MRATMLITAVAIGVAAALGSVSAADQFTTLNGVKVVRMSPAELNAVRGMDHHFFITLPNDSNPNIITVQNGTINKQPNNISVLDPNASDNSAPLSTDGRFGTDQHQDSTGGGNFITITRNDGKTMEVSPAYNGLANACSNGVIVMPLFITC